ncbi:triacylglycerol lipase [Moritella sp. 24]|uniref:lipase family alpha/beta hydrolase n=1 Tax=Moritella sp. 24 TaxID=2746230 RepID=UPI001BAC477A|nr:triacylglycerol lipase [Moritella sp. 24]QUM76811.1 triacylglycerol lipase [Moritella sp. 24]
MKRILTFFTLCIMVFNSHAGGLIGSSSQKGYTETKYPIVLVHGLFGFDSIIGIDYFYGVSRALTRSGATVYVAQVSAANSTEERGEQLLAQVQQIVAATGADKVNLIGHSHGGPTSRYVASVAPQYVASVTSIGGVNKGSLIADIIRDEVPEGSISEELVVAITAAFSDLINFLSGGGNLPQDPIAALEALTTKKSLEFNQSYPEGIPTTACGEGEYVANNGVYYYSWSGTANFTNLLDPIDAALMLTGSAFSEPNDGLVSACSSHLGKVIRDDYDMNHVDEINHTLGIHHLFETDPKTLYRQHANRLQLQGL